MFHVPDFTPMEHPQLIAVGYLAQGEPFSRGPIGEVFVGALLDLLLDPWQPSVAAGFHRCDGPQRDRKSTRQNSSHPLKSRMPSSA